MSQGCRGVGERWETWAAHELARHGLKLLHRNYQCRVGEIDLVMGDGETLVFVEVRYRRRTDYGGGAASVSAAKQRRLINAARHFLARHPKLAERPCRFDVVAIAPGTDREPAMNWIRSAFDAVG